jgi:hypothetical protein
MNFEGLVLSILNESPDSANYKGNWYSFDDPQENPITFIITDLLVVPDITEPWNDEDEEPNSYDSGLGPTVVYSPTTIPTKNIQTFNFEEQNYGNEKFMTHGNIDDAIASSRFNYTQLTTLRIRAYNPDQSVDQFFKQLQKKHPNVSYHLANYDSHEKKNKGRVWTTGREVLVSMWKFDKETIANYVLPFVRRLYPHLNKEIYIERPGNKGWIKQDELEGHTEAKEKPHEREIGELLMQFHIASGDEKKKNQIRSKIKEICSKHNLDPKKYGISDEVLKGSQITAQKLLGSKEGSVAELRARQQTSESLFTFFYKIKKI